VVLSACRALSRCSPRIHQLHWSSITGQSL
jgi:hypothetical protein